MDASEMVHDVVEALRRERMSFEVLAKGSSEESSVVEWLETAFPMEAWGRVGWERVERARCRSWQTWQEMTRAYEDLLAHVGGEPDTPVFLVWSNAARPILGVPFAALRSCGPAILAEDFDVWILCPAQGWCIEKYHEGELCCGWSARHGA